MEDLWPSDINVAQIIIKSPVHILREQASLLAQRTKNIVKARIEPYERPGWNNPVGLAISSMTSSQPIEPLELSAQNFEYSFELIAPVLDNYSYLLFVVSFDVNSYPLTVSLAKDLRQEITIEPKANTEAEFLEILRQIFGATKTRNIIQALISQSVSFNGDTEG